MQLFPFMKGILNRRSPKNNSCLRRALRKGRNYDEKETVDETYGSSRGGSSYAQRLRQQ